MKSRRPDDIQALIFKWRKRFWLATAVVVFLMGDVALWTFGRPTFSIPDAAVHRFVMMLTDRATRAWVSGWTPTIATAASFSVSAGSFSTQQRAATFAAALDASGLPILVRSQPEDERYQVLVGPYVSTDEAEHAQRALAASGLGEARLVVDDTMRSSPQRAAVFGGGDTDSQGVLIVAAPGMSSVVFEMRQAPREVEARRTSETNIDIDIGHVTASARRRDVLRMPEGVLLARELSVEDAGSGDGMRAHLVVPEGIQSRLRLEGRRVYVDLAWPTPPWEVGGRVSRAAQNAPVIGKPSDAQSEEAKPQSENAKPQFQDAKQGDYREQLQIAVERFEQIQPFLISALESPDTEVLAVLARTLKGVSEKLAAATPPSDLAANHQLLLSSIAEASRAMAPSFAGDRRAAVHQAIAVFQEARK